MGYFYKKKYIVIKPPINKINFILNKLLYKIESTRLFIKIILIPNKFADHIMS